ncbi:hypothetical protein [Microbacterium aurum]|jgi:very-short-patch-repair endonuclease|uniref:hypothetical protein n=1 Tax=Microbacterium aurum TaxID=36805 RepID=UPI00248E67CA|nr:hypothetical protein [Microbacterium aurum]
MGERSVRYEKYLTEAKLVQIVQEISGSNFEKAQAPVSGGSRSRWDCAFRAIDGRRVCVEFDGNDHYQSSLAIKADREKDRAAAAQGHRVVRVPYWVQLTTATATHYFGWDITVEQNYAHGFIDSKIFPASFCEMGIERFRTELDSLPISVRDDVVRSLRDRSSRYGDAYVLPTSMLHLLADA